MIRLFLLRMPMIGSVQLEVPSHRHELLASARFASDLSTSQGFFTRFASLELLFADNIIRRHLAHSIDHELRTRGVKQVLAARSHLVTFRYPTSVGVDRRSGVSRNTSEISIAYHFERHATRGDEYVLRVHDVFPGSPILAESVNQSLAASA